MEERQFYRFLMQILMIVHLLGISAVAFAQSDKPFKMRDVSSLIKKTINEQFHKSTDLKIFDNNDKICGLAIDMEVIPHDINFVVRIVVEDSKGNRYLVAETFDEMATSDSILFFNDYCEETAYIDGIIPKKLILHIQDASVNLISVTIGKSPLNRNLSASRNKSITDSIKLQQVQEKINLINAKNCSEGKLWLAGVTPLSLFDYSTKQRIMGFPDDVSTGGIEYYIDGIFEMRAHGTNDSSTINAEPQNRSSSFVKSFTWEYQHGKNWLTPVKDQGRSGFCAAFAAVGCTEAMLNLYLNQKIDLDLSEQEAACCNGDAIPWNGMPPYSPIAYIKNHGICEETAYPFVNDSVESLFCRSSEISNSELVSISGYQEILRTDSAVKHALINYGPLTSGYWEIGRDKTTGHSMVLMGYFGIEEGDTVQALRHVTGGCDGCYGLVDPVVVHDTIKYMGNVIGRTCWVFKDSYFSTGKIKIIFQSIDSCMVGPYRLNTPISWKTINTDGSETLHDDVVCEDADGDGYYFWGIGPKPSSCPPDVPDEPDGDDSNPELGPMDQYGNKMVLYADDRDTIYISSSQVTTVDRNYVNHIVVKDNSTWNIANDLSFFGGATVTIKSGSKLCVSNGAVLNKIMLILEPGSTLEIDDNAKLLIPDGQNFDIPEGVITNFNHGMILNNS